MTILDEPEPWTAGAVCASVDAEVWYPDSGYHSAAAAKRICAGCDVIADCLNYALEHKERWGIWGGLTAHERLGEARRRRLPFQTCRVCQQPFQGIPTAQDCSTECRAVSRRRRDSHRKAS